VTIKALQFPPFLLDAANAMLWRGQQVILLPPKAFDALRYLATHPERLVPTAELLSALWPDVKVNSGVLKVRIRQIRRALGDDAASPRFIETVPRRGYRFIAPVAASAAPVSSSQFQVPSSEIQHLILGAQHSVLVGRETELARLHGWLDKAVNGQRQVVFVTGEPGIGKTTLVEAFLRSLESRVQSLGSENQNPAFSSVQTLDARRQTLDARVWIGRGQCIEHYGSGEAYLPILEALSGLGSGAEGEQLIEVLRKHAPMWLVQMPALLTATEFEALQRKTAGMTKERMLREMAEALEALTTERPLVLVLEDLHWSDPSTLDLLAVFARRPYPARVLILGTYRPPGEVFAAEHPLPAVVQELRLHRQCEALPVGLLTEAHLVTYLAQRFGANSSRDREGAESAWLAEVRGSDALYALARVLHQRTEGNPLFVVNMVDEVLARGDIKSATTEVSAPATIRQLIERQFVQLRLKDQQMLATATVAGAEFSAALVAAGMEAPVEEVEARCAALSRRGHFLRASGTTEWPDGTVAAHYAFLHALYQEEIYERVTAAQRVSLHRRLGERLAAAYGDRAKECAVELAVHFKQGREYPRAVQYLYQAGENAARRNAHREAITHFTAALELLKTLADTPERAQQELTLQLALAVPLMVTKGFAAPEVGAVRTRALDLCRQIGETPQLFPALWGARLFYLLRGELQTARELAERLMPLAQRAQDSALLLDAHVGLGSVLYSLGEVVSARAHYEQALALYDLGQRRSAIDRYGLHIGVSIFPFPYLAQVLWLLGYPDQARKRSREALTLAQKIDYPRTAFIWIRNTEFYQFLQEIQAVQQQAEAVIALCNEHGFLAYLPLGMVQRGWALAEQGQEEEGIQQMQQGMSAHRATGMELYRPYHLALLAEAYGKAGQVKEGLTALAEALAAVDRTGERWYEAELYRLKGELLLQRAREQATGNG